MTVLKKDVVIAGSKTDFMQVRHLRFEGNSESIGQTLGELARDELNVRKEPWTNPQATKIHRDWLERHWPQQASRARGVAKAFDLNPEDNRFDSSFLYYYWAVPGCSNIYYPPTCTKNNHPVLARNYDFSTGTVFELMGQKAPPDYPNATTRPFVIEVYPDKGYPCIYTASYELLGSALDGVNSEGLSIALLASVEVLHGDGFQPRNQNGVGLSETQLVRFILETCATAEEARVALLSLPQYYIHIPCHYLIGDRHGDGFVWSHASRPNAPLCANVRPGKPLPITNHLPIEPALPDCPPRAESVARLCNLEKAIAKAGPVLDDASIRRASRSIAATEPPGQGQYAAVSPARTLWHAFYDLEERSVEIDFYLGEGVDGEIRRSDPQRFALRR